MPLDFMLAIMRDETQPLDRRFEAAKAASSYCHPKLSAIEHAPSQDTSVTGIEVSFVVPKPRPDEDKQTNAVRRF